MYGVRFHNVVLIISMIIIEYTDETASRRRSKQKKHHFGHSEKEIECELQMLRLMLIHDSPVTQQQYPCQTEQSISHTSWTWVLPEPAFGYC